MSNTTRNIIAVTALTILLGYTFTARRLWLGQLEQQAQIGRQILFLNDIDLSKKTTISWQVPLDQWQYDEGEARLSLVMNQIPKLPRLRREGSTLRVKISAHGILKDGTTNDRLIRDWYYTTDEPFINEPKLWESGGSDTVEYGLGGIAVHPFEQLVIEVQVQSPLPAIQEAKPRLQFAAKYDYAIDEHLPFLKLLSNIAYGLSVIATLALFIDGWRTRRNHASSLPN